MSAADAMMPLFTGSAFVHFIPLFVLWWRFSGHSSRFSRWMHKFPPYFFRRAVFRLSAECTAFGGQLPVSTATHIIGGDFTGSSQYGSTAFSGFRYRELWRYLCGIYLSHLPERPPRQLFYPNFTPRTLPTTRRLTKTTGTKHTSSMPHGRDYLAAPGTSYIQSWR